MPEIDFCPGLGAVSTLNSGPGVSPGDGSIAEKSEEKLQPKKIKSCPQDAGESDLQQAAHLENLAPEHQPVLKPPAASLTTKTVQEIDQALKIAEQNFAHLRAAEQVLDHLECKEKREKDYLVETVQKTLDQLFIDLLTRKKSLQEEIKNKEDYIADVKLVKQSIEKKIKSLYAAMGKARTFKWAPSRRPCSDMDLVIQTLRSGFDRELSQVKSLKFRHLAGFSVEETGVMEGHIPQRIKEKEVSFSESFLAESHKLNPTEIGEETPILLQPETNDENSERIMNIQPQDMTSRSLPRSMTTLPQAPWDPDVIIEEIIDDDTESESNVQMELSSPPAQELVMVSHVVHPCHFYVRKYSLWKIAEKMEKNLNHFCRMNQSPPEVLELGDRVFVDSKENGMWCRATITGLIPRDDKHVEQSHGPKKYSIDEIAILQVYMIDFGNTEIFTISGDGDDAFIPKQAALQCTVVEAFRLLIRKPDDCEMHLSVRNPLALRCTLKDLVPPHPSECWGERAKMEFFKMVENVPVLMHIYKEEGGVFTVDLKRPPEIQMSSNVPLSVRDTLVFTGIARFPPHLSEMQPQKTLTLEYHPPNLPKLSTEMSVSVCHINSPGDFYIQMVDRLGFLVSQRMIKQVYDNENKENLEILCPVKGQACITKSAGGTWYRAEVTGLPEHQELEVIDVDTGRPARVPLKDIRNVKDEFLSSPKKAIKCKLAHIEPADGPTLWSREAKEKFEEMINDECLICSVTGILEDDVLLVELFHFPHGFEMKADCINHLLVEEGVACYTEGYTVKSDSPEDVDVWDPPLEEILSVETDAAGSDVQDYSESPNVKKLPAVQICNVVSPEKIYFRWLEAETVFERLQEEVGAAYENSEPEQIPWNSNMKCAVLIPELKQWRRGRIINVISEVVMEVFQYDFGIKAEVNITYLRKLKGCLMNLGKFAYECSLVDIRPTGEDGRWTAEACSYLASCLSGTVVKIDIQKHHKTPIPVRILFQGETGCVDVSIALLKRGLAVRPSRFHKVDRSDSDSEMSLNTSLKPKSTEVTTEPKKYCQLVKKGPESVTEHKEFKPVSGPGTFETFKPPIIPSMRTFDAIATWVADDGTIFVIPKLLECEFATLMQKIQGFFSGCGHLSPYPWKKGEAGVVKGADSLWYRIIIVENFKNLVRVQYVDLGHTELILPCHLYPVGCYPEIPQFCIPCRLHNTIPVGDFWQPDALQVLRELLLPRKEVTAHTMEYPQHPGGKLSVHLFLGGISLSAVMVQRKHCTYENWEDLMKLEAQRPSESETKEDWKINFEEFFHPETKTSVLPQYSVLSLPPPGELFPIQVRHVTLPNEVYIRLRQGAGSSLGSNADENAVVWERLDQVLQCWKGDVTSLPLLTDMKTGMPCLAQTHDELWSRGIILSINKQDPLSVLVQLVDSGTYQKLPPSRLRQIPDDLMRYPAQAVKVTLAGFRPPKDDLEKIRIPYYPNWSLEAIRAMVDCLRGKQLHALTLTMTPEPTVLLLEDERYPVYKPLIEMGLADLDE
ncbi:RING finger protein 17-like [Tachyglossus aculeatus]|uniref:RING finger protein 17-like n=1 Tax=Tachyglossus aculeatus TaxID=9261 RepID=UPI0018F422A4|nr:RING finger protein 17-like [Tachyglossus aculeatus]